MEKKKSFIVVGSGAAGWITASYLANTIDNCEVTVIDDSNSIPIGVGESATPSLNEITRAAGIPQEQWLKESDGSIKYGICFENWFNIGSDWFHLFEDAKKLEPEGDSVEQLLKYGQRHGLSAREFNLFHGPLQIMAEKNLAPSPLEVKGPPNIATHVRADLFGETLKSHLIGKVRIIDSKVKAVDLSESGIESVHLSDGTKVTGDVFFDCTGFTRVLISNFAKINPYKDMIADKFIAGRVTRKRKQIFPFTRIEAVNNGWIWEVNTNSYSTSGFVYTGDLMTDQQALDFFNSYWNHEIDIRFSCLKFESGFMSRVAFKNCIANGLSQGFIEPLEATSLALTADTVINFSKLFNKDNSWSNEKSVILDRHIQRFTRHSKKFVKYHYTLSSRNDCEWWRYWSNQKNLEEYMDYLDHFLVVKRYCSFRETIFNHFNLASMLIASGNQYTRPLNHVFKELDENALKKAIEVNTRSHNLNISHVDFLSQLHR